MPIRIFIAFVALFAAVAFPTSAGAATVGECQMQISDLRTDTENVATFVNEKDRNMLLGKLDNASEALTDGKVAGPAQKLRDFAFKVHALGSAGKLGTDDAARLEAAAADALACIEDIGT